MGATSDREEFKRRVDEAAHVIDIDRLGLCPQCGFAGWALDVQQRKLELLVATARDTWG
jgi:5-methyltetrahydropteroyltriglutamate--homocysteine methyltransferase